MPDEIESSLHRLRYRFGRGRSGKFQLPPHEYMYILIIPRRLTEGVTFIREPLDRPLHCFRERIGGELVLPVFRVEVFFDVAHQTFIVPPNCGVWEIIVHYPDA